MSSDFVVFDPSVAPREARSFRSWYAQQIDWDDSDTDPAILSPSLRAWYDDMTEMYPDMNLSEADGREAIDYCFNSHFMYCSMAATETADRAWATAKSRASVYGLGTYDCMSDNGGNNRAIVFPDGPLSNGPSFFGKLFGKAKS